MKSDFHDRFEISVDLQEAKKRFVNRIQNNLFEHFLPTLRGDILDRVLTAIAYELGAQAKPHYRRVYSIAWEAREYIGSDFHRALLAVEVIYKALSTEVYEFSRRCPEIDTEILNALAVMEIDIGIRWKNGKFSKSGAKSLDENLVNEPLHWLKGLQYQGVLQPYSKGLEHFLQATKRPELLSDVITDIYEALEALAKIVTGRDKDLSANAESFLKEVRASEAYKKILKEYIAYANNFRHGVSDQSKKPNLSAAEVESFIYLTGIFIRLALSQP
ncbi:MAG TPA: hypothetical protein PLK30_04115 [Blastocatellia bacterium]|nr:hypothetical protein [Blastocatellia bacterium]